MIRKQSPIDEAFAKLVREITPPTMTEVVITGIVRVAFTLWMTGGNLAFVTAFITGKAFWPAILAFFKSWWYLWRYTHGA
jgi:hypothetical protein